MSKVLYEAKPGNPGFFSIRLPLKINGVVYHPSVCYDVTTVLRPTIDKLVENGHAYLYDQKVTFVNGVARVLSDVSGRPMSTQLTPATAQWQHPAPLVEETPVRAEEGEML